MKRHIIILIAAVLLAACGQRQVDHPTLVDAPAPIWPDYADVTIPAGIAPLNFNVDGSDVERVDVVARGSKGGQLHVQGEWADFDIDEWASLTEQNRGGRITFTVCTLSDGRWKQYRDFSISVSPYPLDDWGLTYRRIQPGYEVGGDIGIYQRDLHTFSEYAILTETAVPGRCMNCHTANRANPAQLTMQIRGEGGGTLIQKDGRQQWLDTKTDSTKAAGSYAYWHPDGNYCAYAVNSVHQSFYVGRDRRIEAYHKFSDIIILDTRTNELVLSPLLQTEDQEIFPAFSADGRTLYYSTSKPCNVPAEYQKVKCSLCAIGFDAATGTYGTTVDTLLNAQQLDKSFTLARPSYDGRWLMYCVTDCSNFPVFHPEADLWLMDLKTRQTRPLTEVNSDDTDSFHNWSTNSHWFVFASRRGDGQYCRLYLASIDDRGRVSKPFLLPQRHPRAFDQAMMDSYNCPDFTHTKVSFDAHDAHRQVFNGERVKVKIR
ncbi:MAG: PD40 domain-containing protein [Prevotella sp.]|nr:PD40 domain-containing protein [Prevotella sp.]